MVWDFPDRDYSTYRTTARPHVNFEQNEREKLIADAASSYFTESYSAEYVRDAEAGELGDTKTRWEEVQALEWPSLLVPTDEGGVGGTFADASALLREMGKFLMTGPLLAHLAGVLALNSFRRDDASARLLRAVADGNAILTWSSRGDSGPATPRRSGPTATSLGDGAWQVSGRKRFVPSGEDATHIILVAATADGPKPFVVPCHNNNVQARTMRTVGFDRLADVQFANAKAVQLSPASVDEVDSYMLLADALATATLIPYMLGGAERVLDLTVSYAKNRQQFGRQIGSFQAIQHHCANMAAQVEFARLMSHKMTWTVDDAEANTLSFVSYAKAFVSNAYRSVTMTAHQVHGGVGVIKESPLYLYSQKAKALELEQGSPEEHLEAIADVLLGTQ